MSGAMSPDHDVSCVLCQRSEETNVTGALSSKDHVTAHQNCLLFSAGIFCKDSPQFDDLFGFSAADVMKEARRGRKLVCSKCKKKGATAGCEVRRCRKSYHYPCAVQDGAQMMEDPDKGKYGLLCLKHHQERLEKTSANGRAASSSNHRREAGSSKTEGNTSSERLSNGSLLTGRDKHAPSSHKGDAGGNYAHGSDSKSSGSMKHFPSKRRLSFFDYPQEPPSKRQSVGYKRIIMDDVDASYEDIEMFAPLESDIEESQQAREDADSPTESTSGRQPDNESVGEEEDDDETDVESESLLETASHSTRNSSAQTAGPVVILTKVIKVEEANDEESGPERRPVHSPPVPQQRSTRSPAPRDHVPPRSVPASPPRSRSAVPPAPPLAVSSHAALTSSPVPHNDAADLWRKCDVFGNTLAVFNDVDEMNSVSRRIQSGQASREESGPEQRPVHSPVPQQRSTRSPPTSHDPVTPPRVAASPQCSSSCSTLPAPFETASSPAALPSKVKTRIDSADFWRSCNAAGCAQAIFADFLEEMNNISRRIQSGRASQEDYDVALTVMEASGKLEELVTKQQEELKHKQMELQRAAVAMKEVVSALKR